MKVFLLGALLFSQMPRISLSVEGADIHTVLRAIAKVAHTNIITTPGVQGKVTVQFSNLPWKEALYALLETNGLAAVEEENLIKVMTLDELQQLRTTTQLTTRVVHLKYAKAEEVAPSLEGLLSDLGTVKVIKRTNSLVIRDSEDRIEQVVATLKNIDQPTPQVLIKARIVKVDRKTAQELGIHWLAGTQDPTQPAHWRAKVLNRAGTPQGIFSFGTLRSGINIDAILTALENEEKAEIISEPSVIVSNNETAVVLDGKKIPIITLDLAGNRVIKFYDVALKLTVTPHITPDSGIFLELHPELSDLSGEATAAGEPIILSSEVQTKLLVQNGETVVIGGIHRNKTGEVKKGLPILSSIPLLGRFFTYTAHTMDKTELMIFVTPVLNQPMVSQK